MSWTNLDRIEFTNYATYQLMNEIKDNIEFLRKQTPIVPKTYGNTWLEFKDANTITIKAGDYYCGSHGWLTLDSDLDWTWTASGQNLGLDTGSEASDRLYYLYGTKYNGQFAVIASTTKPTTGLFDTDIAGTDYDKNIYLGWFWNYSTGNIVRFNQNRGIFHIYEEDVYKVNFTNTSYVGGTIKVGWPTIACLFLLYACPVSGSDYVYLSHDGTNDYIGISARNLIGGDGVCTFWMPLSTPQRYYRRCNSTNVKGSATVIATMDGLLNF